MAKAVAFNEEAAARIAAAVRAVEGIDREGKPLPRDIRSGVREFWAKITSAAWDSGTSRYRYAWTEQERTATGWQDKSGGRSGTTSAGYAIAGRDLPYAGNPVVRMHIDTDSSGDPAYSFEMPWPEAGATDYHGVYVESGKWVKAFAKLHA